MAMSKYSYPKSKFSTSSQDSKGKHRHLLSIVNERRVCVMLVSEGHSPTHPISLHLLTTLFTKFAQFSALTERFSYTKGNVLYSRRNKHF